ISARRSTISRIVNCAALSSSSNACFMTLRAFFLLKFCQNLRFGLGPVCLVEPVKPASLHKELISAEPDLLQHHRLRLARYALIGSGTVYFLRRCPLVNRGHARGFLCSSFLTWTAGLIGSFLRHNC